MSDVLEIYAGDYFDSDLALMQDADHINAFLDELQGSLDARWQLTRRLGSWHTPWFEVKAIESLLSQGYNIYRIRPLLPRLSQYRIIYGYDARNEYFYLLAVAIKRPRNPAIKQNNYHFDYEPNHWITARICAEYDEHGLPRIS